MSVLFWGIAGGSNVNLMFDGEGSNASLMFSKGGSNVSLMFSGSESNVSLMFSGGKSNVIQISSEKSGGPNVSLVSWWGLL